MDDSPPAFLIQHVKVATPLPPYTSKSNANNYLKGKIEQGTRLRVFDFAVTLENEKKQGQDQRMLQAISGADRVYPSAVLLIACPAQYRAQQTYLAQCRTSHVQYRTRHSGTVPV
eukprot:393911-Rhodomonas_salina.5